MAATIERQGNYISDAGGPHGRTLGIGQVVYISPSYVQDGHTVVDVFFKAGNGIAFFTVEEDAYFHVGRNFALLATHP